MDNLNTPKLDLNGDKAKKAYEDAKEHAEEVYHHVKDTANHLYEEGKKTACEAQENLKEYTDNLIHFVREKPVSAILIAGGIGFILSSLLKK